MKKMGAFLTLPFVLAIPPILGWFIGRGIDRLCDTEPFFMYTLILLGVAAGFKELFRIIQRYGNGI